MPCYRQGPIFATGHQRLRYGCLDMNRMVRSLPFKIQILFTIIHFFQRGEIRPKIGLEKQLGKNWVYTMNTGLRINGRFDVSSDYGGKRFIAESNPKPPLCLVFYKIKKCSIVIPGLCPVIRSLLLIPA